MARARNIKPGFYKNDELAECSVWARFIFPGLWMLADREGRLEDRAKRIKGELLPFDSQEVEPLLVELEERGFIRRYAFSGKRCIQIVNFTVHQAPHGTEKDSDLPDENGFLTVNERAKGGFVTGKVAVTPYKNPLVNGATPVIDPPAAIPINGATPVKNSVSNALNPESGFLNPESLYLLPPTGGGDEPEKPKPEYPPGFVRFWDAWPANDRKQAKGKCFDAWRKAGAERVAELVIDHVLSLKSSAWIKDGGQYVPAPLVYLNQRRWEGAEVASGHEVGSFI